MAQSMLYVAPSAYRFRHATEHIMIKFKQSVPTSLEPRSPTARPPALEAPAIEPGDLAQPAKPAKRKSPRAGSKAKLAEAQLSVAFDDPSTDKG